MSKETRKISEMDVKVKGHMVRVIDVVYSPEHPGRLHASPEDCYPAEPEEVEFTPSTGHDLLDELLSSYYCNLVALCIRLQLEKEDREDKVCQS